MAIRKQHLGAVAVYTRPAISSDLKLSLSHLMPDGQVTKAAVQAVDAAAMDRPHVHADQVVVCVAHPADGLFGSVPGPAGQRLGFITRSIPGVWGVNPSTVAGRDLLADHLRAVGQDVVGAEYDPGDPDYRQLRQRLHAICVCAIWRSRGSRKGDYRAVSTYQVSPEAGRAISVFTLPPEDDDWAGSRGGSAPAPEPTLGVIFVPAEPALVSEAEVDRYVFHSAAVAAGDIDSAE